MAKATLEFNLDDPDDQEHFAVASRAKDLWLALWDLSQSLRVHRKYDHVNDAIAKIDSDFRSILDHYGITLEELS